MSSFLSIFEKMDLEAKDFTVKRFLPGSAGERTLFRTLMEQSGLGEYD
jgi:hypothetical protein